MGVRLERGKSLPGVGTGVPGPDSPWLAEAVDRGVQVQPEERTERFRRTRRAGVLQYGVEIFPNPADLFPQFAAGWITARQAAKALNIRRGAGFQPARGLLHGRRSRRPQDSGEFRKRQQTAGLPIMDRHHLQGGREKLEDALAGTAIQFLALAQQPVGLQQAPPGAQQGPLKRQRRVQPSGGRGRRRTAPLPAAGDGSGMIRWLPSAASRNSVLRSPARVRRRVG
jgi:hypothetical protein